MFASDEPTDEEKQKWHILNDKILVKDEEEAAKLEAQDPTKKTFPISQLPKNHRIIKEDDPVTMDLIPNRLNICVHDNMEVEYCFFG
ncbi:hypothetical protein BCR43DRAFT_516800 [Syncephalastrum racemosum]|uniref:Uncharacterized protein n=1 Tax=Syncephalastrum racemosum TaxID=13706 RepID=A0A1X2H5P9_SYNRA|nr:hypothetical protein BCR43DRAFT_516800 [Syncephalastrum racemosum]